MARIYGGGSSALSSALVTSSQTSGFTADSSVDIYVLSGASFTVTLPSAASNNGVEWTFVHNDSTLGRVYTIDGDGATIGGLSTRKICTQGETLTIVSDGTNWTITDRYIPSVRTAYTPAILSFGTISNNSAYWQRVGNMMHVQGTFTSGTQSGVLATIPVPTGLAIGTTSINNTTGNPGPMCGQFTNGSNNNQFGYLVTATATSTANVYWGATLGSGSGLFLTAALGNAIISGTPVVSYSFQVPIADWEG